MPTTATAPPAVETRGLTKAYGAARAVDDITVTLMEGRIYGLIGRNGAGKTTLMRLLCGLARPTSGEYALFGTADPAQRRREYRRIGVLIEEPGLNPGMTARQNMEAHRVLRGIPDTGRIEELLDLVGLGDTGTKTAKHFSLGMRQRLGIAIALLPDPDLLVLDEPVNGLDPQGVVDMRMLFRRLNEERRISFLISSHNLPELHQTATDFLLLDRGRLALALTAAELDERTRHSLRVEAADPAALTAALEDRLGVDDYRVLPDGSVRLDDFLDEPDVVARALADAGVYPRTLVVEGESLESFFLSVVGGAR